MALNSIIKKDNSGKNINYLNKDFSQFRQNLIEYAKTYFPQTYSDFNESSPGMMFIEMASYVGDVLSYYNDDTLKESLMKFADDRRNVIALAYYLGYTPKVTSPAIVNLSVYQLVPAIGTGVDNKPDSTYYLRIKEGMLVESDSGVLFRTTELLDFNNADDREVSVYQRDNQNEPTFYLVKKLVPCISATVKTTTKTFTTPTQFDTIDITDTDVIDVYDVRDSNGNRWYKVPYLAQDMVYVEYPISEQYDKDLLQFKDSVPSVLKLIKTSRRFTLRVNEDNTTSLVFGGGNSNQSDETLIPNFKNVGLGLPSSVDRLGASFDPSNFLKTKTYGQAPSNTTLTVSYLVGGGVDSNVGTRTITRIQTIEYDEDTSIFNQSELRLLNTVKNSIAVENETPARGGKGADTIDEIRENAISNFGSQNRAVTRKDYQVRALAMPSRYGSIAKAYCAPDGELDNNSPSSILSNPDSLQQMADLVKDLTQRNLTDSQIKEEVNKFLIGKKDNLQEKNNPFAVNLYLLGYNSDKKLTTLNRAVKENLKTYMNEFRMLTDGINILDGFIINIGVDFEIRVYGGYNKREVLTKCISEMTDYFNIDKWSFNMPIDISELELVVSGVEGVQSVPELKITNKCLGNYSSNSYNIEQATRGKMVYPSVDPSVFEVKYPNKDIRGRVV